MVFYMNYFAFFRGINVGGKNIVKMVDLKNLFAGLGFGDVKTYIQSGNVIFSSAKEPLALVPLIEKSFAARFGFPCAVVIRTGDELAEILRAVPFDAAEIATAEAEAPDVEHLYVYLSGQGIDRQKLDQLCAAYQGEDKLHAAGRDIYLLCRRSVRDSKLAALLGKLAQPLTARNLKTIAKLAAML